MSQKKLEVAQLYQKLSNHEVCYICNKSGFDLVSPCNKEECEIKVHRECLTKQIEKGNNNCPKCSEPIISTKVNKFNIWNFCNYIFKVLLSLCLLAIGAGSPGILMFGLLIDGRKDESHAGGSYILSIILAGAIVGPSFLFGMISLIASRNCEDLRKKLINNFGENYWYPCSLSVSIIIIDSVVLFSHLCGFIILLIFKEGYHYDPYSFCVGVAFIIVCLITILFISCLSCCCKTLYNENLEEETIYGK